MSWEHTQNFLWLVVNLSESLPDFYKLTDFLVTEKNVSQIETYLE